MEDFETIRDNLSFLDQWEERYKYIIDLGRHLAPLSEAERSDANKVKGCASQVWLVFDPVRDGKVFFRGDSDAHIGKGLVALVIALFSGKPPEDIMALDEKKAFAALDLEGHLTAQRANGLASMVGRIKQQAERLKG